MDTILQHLDSLPPVVQLIPRPKTKTAQLTREYLGTMEATTAKLFSIDINDKRSRCEEFVLSWGPTGSITFNGCDTIQLMEPTFVFLACYLPFTVVYTNVWKSIHQQALSASLESKLKL